MKIVTCFKLVPEEQDIVVTPERSLNFDRVEAKISQFDLNAIEAAAQLAAEGDEILALTVGGSLLQNSKVRKDVLSRGPDSLFMVQDAQLEHALPRDTAQALACAEAAMGRPHSTPATSAATAVRGWTGTGPEEADSRKEVRCKSCKKSVHGIGRARHAPCARPPPAPDRPGL